MNIMLVSCYQAEPLHRASKMGNSHILLLGPCGLHLPDSVLSDVNPYCPGLLLHITDADQNGS